MIGPRASVFLVFGAVLCAVPGNAQLRTASIEDIVAAADVCGSAVVPGSVDAAPIIGAGWVAGTSANDDGALDAAGLTIYGRVGNNAIILNATRGPTRICNVMARLSRVSDFSNVSVGLQSAWNDERLVQVSATEQMFFTNGNIVTLTLTGSASQPGVRISVMKMEAS